MTIKPLPRFTMVMPVLNEERYVELALSSLLDQVEGRDGEILVLDGGSRDATRAIVTRMAVVHPVIRLVDNPRRTQSAACNLAAELAHPQSAIMLRADAHAAYPSDFVATVLRALLDTDATSVAVPMRTVGKLFVQRAIAATQNSRLGNGGSSHRRAGRSRFVDHGHHAAFDLAFFRTIGGYDRDFTHNEDAELDVRAVRAGGRVWLCTEATIDYFPRDSLRQLARQYVRHGRGRARTIAKHRLRLKLRQGLPLVILATVALAALGPLFPWLAVPAAFYLLACLGWGVVDAARRADAARLLMGPTAVVMHLSWAIGFLQGRLRSTASGGRPAPALPQGVEPAGVG